jgi:ornithine cyclodeaminase
MVGARFARMGADTKSKQEVDQWLLVQPAVFSAEIAQSTSVGAAQHAVATKTLFAEQITPIREVIDGFHPGHQEEHNITLLDGTGVGL